jgi:DNA-binding response OmpR family regulator
MFENHAILIVEDEPLIAEELAMGGADLKGRVLGPVPTVAAALAILEHQEVTAAILDANLQDRDVTPVGLLLARRHVPFIVHSGLGVPPELARAVPQLRLVLKPAAPHTVLAHLLATIAGD